MTDQPPSAPPPSATTVFALLAFLCAGGNLGWMVWEKYGQPPSNPMAKIESELDNIHNRLNSLSIAQKSSEPPYSDDVNQRLAAIEEQLRGISEKIDHGSAPSAVNEETLSEIKKLSAEQSNVAAHMADMAAAKAADQAQAERQQALRAQSAALYAQLEAIAPELLMPAVVGNGALAKIQSAWQQLITVRPRPSAAADQTTVAGKISYALYALRANDVAGAMAALPDDPRLSPLRAQAGEYMKLMQLPITTAPDLSEGATQ